MEDTKRKNSKIIKISQTDLHQFMLGKKSITLPEDTDMVAVRDCFHQGTIDFVLRSTEFDEVKTGDVIPCFSPMVQRVVPVGHVHANSLAAMVKYFKELAKSCNFPETEIRTDTLTSEYCDELIEALNA